MYFEKKLAQLKRFNKILRNFFYYLKNNEKANEKKKLVAYIHMFFKQMTSYEYDFKQRNKIIFLLISFTYFLLLLRLKKLKKWKCKEIPFQKYQVKLIKGLQLHLI